MIMNRIFLFAFSGLLFLPSVLFAEDSVGMVQWALSNLQVIGILFVFFALPFFLFRLNAIVNWSIVLTAILLGSVAFYFDPNLNSTDLINQLLYRFSLLFIYFLAFSTIDFQLRLQGTPEINTFYLAMVSVIANALGTAGATLVFAPAFFRMNQNRSKVIHIPVFFILIITNGAGILSPLGSRVTYLEFLSNGNVESFSGLLPLWLITQSVLLFSFYVMDWIATTGESQRLDRRKVLSDRVHRAVQNQKVNQSLMLEVLEYLDKPMISVRGALNILGMAAILGIVFFYRNGTNESFAFRESILMGVALLVYLIRGKVDGFETNFRWSDFSRIISFTIVTFLILYFRAEAIGRALYELAGQSDQNNLALFAFLSAFIDTATVYHIYQPGHGGLLGQLSGPVFESLSKISEIKASGFIMTLFILMGSVTYSGNIFNFITRNISEEEGIRAPGFFFYLLYSIPVIVLTLGAMYFMIGAYE